MKRILIPCLLVMLAACGDDDDDLKPSKQRDSGVVAQEPGVCNLARCPASEAGIKCCTPYAQCGFDPTGTGLTCVPNSGAPPNGVCTLSVCEKEHAPLVGNACCTPYAECGFDPYEDGQFCFAFPPDLPVEDAGTPVCEASTCAATTEAFGCCLPNGECGLDLFGDGNCFAQLPETDGGTPPPVSTTPPDDPSVDGQCPSFLGTFGPIWGCCSEYGVCGTFDADTCLLAVGTPIPLDPDADAGADAMRCTPPAK